jgi:hypothetical protein
VLARLLAVVLLALVSPPWPARCAAAPTRNRLSAACTLSVTTARGRSVHTTARSTAYLSSRAGEGCADETQAHSPRFLALIGVLEITTDVLGNIVASLLQDQLGNYTWLIGVLFLVIAALDLGLTVGEKWQAHRQDRRLALDRRNRQDMLAKVRAIWITDTLQRSLVHEILIDLDLEERAAAVIRPLDLLVQRPDHADRRLPPGTRMVEMFDELGRAFLILGVAGVGKTTRLLELTRDLLDRAVEDLAHRIPVVFKLSSWAIQQRPLAAWLVEALHEQYGISRAIGQA